MARFRDTDPNAGSSASERSRLAKANERIEMLEANINAFIAAVDEVTFNVDEADAQSWMSNWGANLLSGRIGPDPVPDPVDVAADVADEDTAADPR